MSSDTQNTRSDYVNRLLADAHLLQHYLADAGLLEGNDLGQAISAMEKGIGHDDEADCLANLGVQVSKANKLASPFISIVDLRAGRSPFNTNPSQQAHTDIKEIVISALAVLLIFATVLGFVVLQDVSRGIAELQRISLQNPMQKMSELRRLIYEGALVDQKSAYYIQYQKAASEVALMFEVANSIMARAPTFDSDQPNGIIHDIVQIILFETAGKNVSKAPGKGQSSLQSSKTGGYVPGYTAEDYGKWESPGTCKPYDSEPVKSLIGDKNVQYLAAALDKFDDYCLAQTLEINVGNYRTNAVANSIRALQEELVLVGVLFLPLVGGLLGSAIFVIHTLMNNKLSAPLTWGYSFVRIIVGGAFGVIIGWFVSTSTDSADLAQRISGTPFTLAFLAGFSIETLSNVLLRYSKVTTENQKT